MNEKYDFRMYLKDELDRRVNDNPNYSLRSFARFLDCDPSYLSKVLSGKKNISKKFISEKSKKLHLPEEEVDLFVSVDRFSRNEEENADYDYIEYDKFKSMSDWYFDAILELTKFPGHKASVDWISSILDLKEEVVEEALEVLKNLDLLEIREGKLIDLSAGNTTNIKSPEYSSLANRNYQKQVLKKSMDCLDSTSINQRDHSSMMMATNSKKMAAAKVLIKKFRRKLCTFLEDTDEIDSVYLLSTSIFPITNTESKENINE